MKDRLIQLLDIEQLTPSKFADLIGVQRSSISHVLSGRNNPSYDFLTKTLKAFPGLNAEWLMLGKGTMYEHMGREAPGKLFDTAPEISGDRSEARIEEHAAQEETEQEEPDTREYFGMEEAQKPEERKRSEDKEDEMPDRQRLKRVVKVMIFYEDDTFKSFEPSQ